MEWVSLKKSPTKVVFLWFFHIWPKKLQKARDGPNKKHPIDSPNGGLLGKCCCFDLPLETSANPVVQSSHNNPWHVHGNQSMTHLLDLCSLWTRCRNSQRRRLKNCRFHCWPCDIRNSNQADLRQSICWPSSIPKITIFIDDVSDWRCFILTMFHHHIFSRCFILTMFHPHIFSRCFILTMFHHHFKWE